MSLDGVKIPSKLGNYLVGEKLGAGFSGAIYRARHVHTGQVVAIKVQHVDEECPTNRYERGFYPSLQGAKGMPTLWYSGIQGEIDYLVMDLLGPSLDNLYRKNGKQAFDVRSVCCVAIQLIDRLQFMHSRGILHRDIQLGNATIGLPPNEKTIYMIDFGFSKRYIDPHTSRHIADNRKPRDFIGNYWFSSVNVHCRGRIPTRRDDLEAAALMLIHMLTPGGLPWTRNGVPREDDEHDRLKRAKKAARPETLCKHLPSEFEEFLRYTRTLRFADCPDYDRWKEEFRGLMTERGWGEDDAFVWPPPPTSTAPALRQSPAKRGTPLGEGSMERVLQDLAKLDLRADARPVLGDRTGVVNTPPAPAPAPALGARKVSKPGSKPGSQGAAPARPKPSPAVSETIVISDSDSEAENVRDKVPEGTRLPKAVQLRGIAAAASMAADNLALAHAVGSFARVLADTGSRSVTREGFAVLDTLVRQLADPSVFVTPLRGARVRAGAATENAPRAPRYEKMSRLAELRREVAGAGTNAELARLVQDFGKVIDASNGRTITKDGYAFLDALGTRLKALA